MIYSNKCVNTQIMDKVEMKPRKRGRPPADKSKGRADIKSAALREFSQRGFKAASIEKIAESAGVAKALIHYHFSTKGDLWKEAVSEAFDEFRGRVEGFASEFTTGSREQSVDDFAYTIVRFHADNPELSHISMNETRIGGERADWLKETYLYPMHQLVTSILGALSSNDDPEANRRAASRLIPSLVGAINFPYLDADVISGAYKADVFSDEYVHEHAAFIAMLMRACIENDKTHSAALSGEAKLEANDPLP